MNKNIIMIIFSLAFFSTTIECMFGRAGSTSYRALFACSSAVTTKLLSKEARKIQVRLAFKKSIDENLKKEVSVKESHATFALAKTS